MLFNQLMMLWLTVWKISIEVEQPEDGVGDIGVGRGDKKPVSLEEGAKQGSPA